MEKLQYGYKEINGKLYDITTETYTEINQYQANIIEMRIKNRLVKIRERNKNDSIRLSINKEKSRNNNG